jgi:transcriptional regulator with XRE-family HTH domain
MPININASSENLQAIEPDDLDAYLATFDERERRDLTAAEAAIDIAILLFRARERRGLSQTAAAQLAGLQQQAVSRFEHPTANPQLASVQAYLGALGYALELKAIDVETGEVAAEVTLPPTVLSRARRIPARSRRGPRSPRRQATVDRTRQVATG